MFDLMSTVDASDKEAQYMNLIKKLDNEKSYHKSSRASSELKLQPAA
jgi:hypothetical protein